MVVRAGIYIYRVRIRWCGAALMAVTDSFCFGCDSLKMIARRLFLSLLLPALAGAQIACVLEHCALALAACEADATCRTWSTCNRNCGSDLPCQLRCADLYKPTNASSAKIDAFSECVISEHHCIPQAKEKCPLPAAHGLASTFDLTASLTGVWYITRGFNRQFDCYDCQVHNFTYAPEVAPMSKPLHGDLKYNVKVDLNCSEGSANCTYLAREVHQSFGQDPSVPAHLENHNNSLAELHYSDDWYVLYASESAVLIYYCGCNDATCGYSGSVLYSRTPKLPSDAEQGKIAAAIKAAAIPGFSFDGMCVPDNWFC
jgi:violaxanthin de-epoxidase